MPRTTAAPSHGLPPRAIRRQDPQELRNRHVDGVLYASFNPAPRLPRKSRALAVSMNADLE